MYWRNNEKLKIFKYFLIDITQIEEDYLYYSNVIKVFSSEYF